LIYINSPFGGACGTIDAREKFRNKRIELARRVRAHLRANDSLECRNCCDFDSMDFMRRTKQAADEHSTASASIEKIGIDRHQGIAVRLPDVSVREAALH
jgi:cytochrome c-type protein NapC